MLPHHTPRHAVVTGAGSGVGRAIALALAEEGWKVALLGRRREALEETARLSLAEHSPFLICPTDIADPAAVSATGTEVLAAFGHLDALINAAGTNTPRRSLEVLTPEDYRRLLATSRG